MNYRNCSGVSSKPKPDRVLIKSCRGRIRPSKLPLKAIWVIILLNRNLCCKGCWGILFVWSFGGSNHPHMHCWHISSNLQRSEKDAFKSEIVHALRQLTKCAGGRFSRLTYFPFVSVAACWKIGCILLHTPHPATKIQNRTAEVITENSMGNTALTASIQLSKDFPSSARGIVFFVVVVESSLQHAIGCERYNIVKTTDHNNWTHLLLSNNRRHETTIGHDCSSVGLQTIKLII